MRIHDYLIGGIAIAGIALSTLTGAKAAPLMISSPIVAQAAVDGNLVTKVQHRPRFERHGKDYWYNGHRGSRRQHRGWREYRGWWFPPAAFAFSFGTAPQRAAPRHYDKPRRNAPQRYDRPRHDARGGGLSPRHYRWCQNRYRSYRASDNTFQPYNGPRRRCRSPF
ncbi:BA14K family protein [Roseibium limicola]|uniref:Lectin-like protein BA14k n=1 Tax=Roseibium limicola TaxID=2816037 RepID=A0A939J4N3_9HYPH|nr:BA14K family protein [Roseibium limicola]MBO0344930.1 BA14K family protein [Roseibium limicola]